VPRVTAAKPPSGATEPYRATTADVATQLDTDLRRGLSEAEARARLAQFGPNELAAEPTVPAWRRFLAQFTDVLVLLLLAATVISAALWAYERDTTLPYEAITILVVVLLNAVMGYLQESRAAAAIAALRAITAAEATVIRDGERHRVPARTLVAGDLLLVEEGDTVAADARVVTSTALQTAEAALTGESLPVNKDDAPLDTTAALGDQSNMVFGGTAVTYGHGTAIVTATGMHSEIGRIAGLLHETHEEETPLQRELDYVGKLLGGIVLVIAVVMIATIIVVDDVHGLTAILDVLILGVALAVAAVPEGLPAVVTAVLSLGVQRMAKRNAIVRHLGAVETLGAASIVASDKTGTLTKNEMTVRVVVTASGRFSFTGSGYSPEGEVRCDNGDSIEGDRRIELDRALAAADRANNAEIVQQDGRWSAQGDPTEGALLVAARKAGIRHEDLDRRLPREAEVPFSSERKIMSTINRAEADERLIVFSKGAPDVILPRCSHEIVGDGRRALTQARRDEILRMNELLADEALRTLGVAAHWLPAEALDSATDVSDLAPRVEHDLSFAGLVGMIDPPRAEAAVAVARARSAGIRPVMITGDHPRTAAVIARELDITQTEGAVTGAELDTLSEEQLAETVKRTSVYARVNPEHKLRLVKALQSQGEIVAMTGDGVNDAPALKMADIGVAMGITGTDVSKEAADVVLADDDFATIVAAVEEGRAIFENIRKFLRFLLSSNIGEVLTMFFGVILAPKLGLAAEGASGVALPLLATQILWINLVTDGAPALALGVDPAEPELMQRPPRPRHERVITGQMWIGIVFVGVVMAATTLLVIDASLPGGLIEGTGDLAYAHTMAFTTLIVAQLFNTFNARSDERSAFVHLFANRWLWGAIGLSLVLQLLVLYVHPLQHAFSTVPLTLADWVRCTVAASTVFWAREISKLVRRWVRPRRQRAAQPAL
jgi:Ca2+-transporting ATPase